MLQVIRTLFGWLCSRDMLVLFVLLCVVLAVWLFIEIADNVVEGKAQATDERLVRRLRNPDDVTDPLGPKWLEEMGRDLTALGGIVVVTSITTVVVGFLLLARRYSAAGFMFVAVVGGWGLSTLLKHSFDRPRPDVVPHLSHVMTSSFPSGHSMLAAVVYLTIGSMLARIVEERRLKLFFIIVALALTLLVGISRVYLGVHYPTDVLAGWAAGLTWAMLCWLAMRWLQHRGLLYRNQSQP